MRYLLLIVFVLTGLSDAGFAQKTAKYNVYLRSDAGVDTMWDGRQVRIYGIASKLSEMPHIPAKTLYCNEGDTLVLNALSISQGDFHTIHLHGLDADTRNDGDPATSFELHHMQDTTYSVVAANAGTYIYHCHVADVVHVQMGMYGLIVVRPKDGSNTTSTNGPKFDRSYNWILSELDPAWHDSIPTHDHLTDTVHIPPYNPKYFLINGKSESQLTLNDSIRISAKIGEKIYLRVGAIGFFYQRMIFPHSLHARKIDSDGRPLEEAITNDTVEIAPGERYGITLDASESGTDQIVMEFVNMNTDSVWSRQQIPVSIILSEVNRDPIGLHPSNFSLFPNPASSLATITYTLTKPADVRLEIYDLLGKKVKQVAFGYENEGEHSQIVDTQSLNDGTYICRISCGGIMQAQSFQIVK